LIVDSSVLVAILQAEPGYIRFLDAILAADQAAVPAPNYLETCMVLAGRKSEAALDRLDAYMRESNLSILPFTADHALIARQAFLRYGKGRHRAGLNFGDCIAYAAAKLEGMPLLFKGDDFKLTDVEAALPAG
jgi:ribonuclease VapC